MNDPCRERCLAKWRPRIERWFPGWMEAHPVLRNFREGAGVVLYGSLTQGFDDEFADVDLWLLLSDDRLRALDAGSSTRFFEFESDGKKGHMTAHTCASFRDKVHRCDMDTIFHLRRAVLLADPGGAAGSLCRSVLAPMPAMVRRAFFMHHYIEMRSEHRACDNPIERRDPVALLLSLPKAVAHALRAAMVLDGEPYPYDKWLYHAARRTPTGAELAPHVEAILDLLAGDGLRSGRPERDHPLSLELRAIRRVLIDRARAGGIDEPWLISWWLAMDEDERQFAATRWSPGGPPA